MYLRDVRTSLELFRKENIPLSTKETTAIQDYQKITSTMSVEHNGETKTLQQMATFLTSTDRVVREDAWKKIARRRLQDKERLDEAFDKLFKLRIQIAKNSGYEDYLDYIFKAKSASTILRQTAAPSTKASKRSSFRTSRTFTSPRLKR